MNLLEYRLDAQRGNEVTETPLESLERVDMRERMLFADFGWDPTEFRNVCNQRYYQEFLERENAELTVEQETYENPSLYEFSGLTCMLEGPNCYAFAMQWPINPLTDSNFMLRPSPGDLAHGFGSFATEQRIDNLRFGDAQDMKDFFLKMMRDDTSALGMSIKEVDQNYQPKEGEWLIALATSENTFENPDSICDYHFYRKGTEGVWYHKPGPGGRVQDVDSAGNHIFDPAECARGPYQKFLGYFAVTGPEGAVQT